MDKHCKNCVAHNNAGHPAGSPNEAYNDWCCLYSNFCKKVIGHCKMKNGKMETNNDKS